MAIQRFDEVENLYRGYSESWFDKMDISEGDKKRRVQLSLDYCEIIIMLFMMIEENETRDNIHRFAEERLNVIADRYIGKDDVAYINDWAKIEADNIVDKTFEKIAEVEQETENSESDTGESTYHFEEFDVDVPKTEYWTSDIRGLLLGIECANSVANYYELYDALEKGYTHKVWLTEADNRVRATHQRVDHVDIPITDLFEVGDSLLLFPGDVSNGASPQEIDNCRCTLSFY